MTTLLQQEIEPLIAQIEQVRTKLDALEADLRLTEVKLETIPQHEQRFEALQEVCTALDRLTELEAAELFWSQLAQPDDAERHRHRLQERIEALPEKIQRVQERQAALKEQIADRNIELDVLFEEVHDAYAREQHRQEELVIEREISSVPGQAGIMPWSSDSENEKSFRRSMMVAMLLFFVIGSIMYWVPVPVPEWTPESIKIPERLAKLVKKEDPKPEPPPKVAEEPKPSEPTAEKPKVDETKTARTKAESSGVLAFKNTFKELMNETPVAGLGSQARLSKGSGKAPRPGSVRASRSLVAIQGKSGSGGISHTSVSRNIGGGDKDAADKIGSVGFSRIESSVAGLQEETGRQVSDGPGPSRTDEEIQIVFDRYKATLYRIYNKALRKNPTLRGNILLRLTIEPAGTVSNCKAEKTDLASAELVAAIIERVGKFNFGPKEGVSKTTILYPIDFLPAG